MILTPHKLKPDLHRDYYGITFLIAALCLSPLAGAQPTLSPDGNASINTKFNPTVSMIVIVVVAVLFFMVFVSIYILQCGDSGTVGNSISRITGASMRGRPRGLDPDVIEAFPTFVYSSVKGLKIGRGALECAVCLSEFEDDETLRLIPKCDHVFHPECIDEWLAAHTTCPVCRANLVPQPDESVHIPIGLVVNPETDRQTGAEDGGQNGQNDCDDNNINVNGSGNRCDNDDGDVNDSKVDKAEDSVKGDKKNLIEGGGSVGRNLKRNRTRGSRWPRRFSRSHSTGHSLVQPGENIDRFTLRLPEDVRKQLLDRASSMRTPYPSLEGGSRKGYRFEGEGSGRGGKIWRRLDRTVMSDRWVFNRMPSFFQRMSSIRSPREPVGGESWGESSHTSRPPV